MVTPQRGLRTGAPAEQPARQPEGRDALKRASKGALGRDRRRGVRFRRVFVLLLAPVLLMLGSVYVHTVAAGLEGEAARLENEKAGIEDDGERLEVQITELSDPGRLRELARKNLGMQDPGEDLATYDGNSGEDVANGTKDKGAGK